MRIEEPAEEMGADLRTECCLASSRESTKKSCFKPVSRPGLKYSISWILQTSTVETCKVCSCLAYSLGGGLSRLRAVLTRKKIPRSGQSSPFTVSHLSLTCGPTCQPIRGLNL
jgi:hypothetical protein